MKHGFLRMIAIASVASTLFLGCSGDSGGGARARVPARDRGAPGANARADSAAANADFQRFIAGSRARLDTLDQRIRGLRNEAEQRTGRARVELDRAVADLERQRTAGEQRLRDAERAGRANWQTLRTQLDDLFNRADRIVRDATGDTAR